MKIERFHKVEDLFHRARSLDRADRAALLHAECGSALDLRAEVESLLAHADQTTTWIDAQRAAGHESMPAIVNRGPLSEGPGTRIGPYKILQKIGEGGFGVVYMAEQVEPMQRMVALKIIKVGMDTKQVIARFESERQALAIMDHPNIARVLDAGATETGRPYFVMELVKGVPITEYCDHNKLSMRARLDLFMQVCEALQHAHQKGIIHRDVKPSNVLVTLHDTRAVPKVIDFGIAKATSRRLTERTLFTEFRQFIGTPEYMSPDQADISGLDIDTRSDIYSLGVLLYQLLTGTTPIDPATLRTAAYGEIQRIICEVDPPKPSTRVETLLGTGGSLIHQTAAEPQALSRLMRGDLDWIVMKAMEKDRTRRYQTAGEFAADIDRYLHDQPVLAGPPSVLYKLRKFVRRHRLGAAAALLIGAAIVVGAAAATTGMLQARQEARRSQRIADFLQDLFLSTNPDEAIASGADVEGVLATARQVFGDDHATVAATLSSRALQLQSAGSLEAAERLYGESLRLWRESYGADNVNVGTTLARLGLLQVTKGDMQAAEGAFREALQIIDRGGSGSRLASCEPRSILAGILVNRGEYAEAEALMRESIAIRRREAPEQALQIALNMSALSNVLVLSGRTDEGSDVFLEMLDAWRAALPSDNPFLAHVLANVGVWFVRNDDYDVAEPLLREAMEILDRSEEPALTYRVLAVRGLSRILHERADWVALIPISMQAVDLAAQLEGGRYLHDEVKDLGNIAWKIASEAGRAREGYEVALRAIDRALAEEPDDPAFINTRGVVEYRLGRDEDALATFEQSHAHYVQEFEHGVPADLAFMAMANHRLGREVEAMELLARLRLAMEDPVLGASEENMKHMVEAEALIEGR